MSTYKCKGRYDLTRPIIKSVPAKPGVYAFWHKEIKKCIYVGKSKNLRERLLSHYLRESHNKELHEWIKHDGSKMQICFLEVEVLKITKFEDHFIYKFNPRENKDKPKEEPECPMHLLP